MITAKSLFSHQDEINQALKNMFAAQTDELDRLRVKNQRNEELIASQEKLLNERAARIAELEKKLEAYPPGHLLDVVIGDRQGINPPPEGVVKPKSTMVPPPMPWPQPE